MNRHNTHIIQTASGRFKKAPAPIPNAWITSVFQEPGSVLLENGLPLSHEGYSYLFTQPHTSLKLDRETPVRDFFKAIHHWQQAGYYLAGFLTYEAGYLLEPTLPPPPEGLLGWFGVYPEVQIWDHQASAATNFKEDFEIPELQDLTFQISPSAYRAAIQRIREHIRQGDVYQLNFTAPFTFHLPTSVENLYRFLRHQQPVPFQAVIHLDDRVILSFSPELFFAINDNQITTCPMKGTHRRGRYREEDEAFSQFLKMDEKNRAENVMIVDLLRNDLARLCSPGTVRVTDLFRVERFTTVLQMVSQIEGRLNSRVTWFHIFKALFPSGSITGAPKIRAQQILHTLEPHPRGIYTGTIGYITPEGNAAFSVAIRTIEIQNSKGKLGVGGGIVWDSQAETEYEECHLKAQFLIRKRPSFNLLETMRVENGISFLQYHLDRLENSAVYFQFPFDRQELTQALLTTAQKLDSRQVYRLRLLLLPSGKWEMEISPLPTSHFGSARVALAHHRVHSQDVFLYHKTTHRQLFDGYWQHARRHQLADVLFLNEKDEITQGCISNLFAVIDGQWVTPALNCGLLNGVLRRQLLETMPIEEHILKVSDLRHADALYIGNALRGLHRVALIPEVFKPPGEVI